MIAFATSRARSDQVVHVKRIGEFGFAVRVRAMHAEDFHDTNTPQRDLPKSTVIV